MKRIILLSLLMCYYTSFSQSKYEVTNTIEVAGATKDDLFNKAKYWISENFKSAKDIIQLQDKEEGQIIVKAGLTYNAPAFSPGTNYSGLFMFTFTFDAKDGKYRYKIDRISHDSYMDNFEVGSFDRPRKRRPKIIRSGMEYINDFAKSFEAGMTQELKKDKNW